MPWIVPTSHKSLVHVAESMYFAANLGITVHKHRNKSTIMVNVTILNWVKGYTAVAENSSNASILFSFSVQTMQFTKYFDATDVADTMLEKC